MKILFGRCFGLGNAVMSIPTIKCLYANGHDVDVLVGSTGDDSGAFDVFRRLKSDVNKSFVGNIYFDKAGSKRYDRAIMSIPFDGRWRNGEHFFADEVVDCRTRPDPSTVGLSSWKKHEVEYSLENADTSGFNVNDFSMMSFTHYHTRLRHPKDKKKIYIGLGYKKDDAGFWAKKHWGNDNYINLIGQIIKNTDADVVMTGNNQDFVFCIRPIVEAFEFDSSRIHFSICSFDKMFNEMGECDLYVGNDTGTMHVAASMGIPCIGLFFLENSIVKNRPWGTGHINIDGSNRTITVEEVFGHVTSRIA